MKKAEINKLNLMQIMEVVLEKTYEKKLSPANLKSIQPLLAALASRLFITEREALMLTAFINLCDDSRISFHDLAVILTAAMLRFKPIGPRLSLWPRNGTYASAKTTMVI